MKSKLEVFELGPSHAEAHLYIGMPQLIFQTLKNNYSSQDIIFKIGITRATAYTGFLLSL